MIKTVAIYLPQFHPIKENDEWWGKGFTEWTNVTKAKPLFKGHYQPHLPADLGFYDLRLSEIRIAQAELAKSYGIDGFCYYHYWFNGKRLIERPFEEVVKSGKPDFPFMLCWANETWSRRWIGDEKEILIKQTYSEEDDFAHGKYLAKIFTDPRYIRYQNKPVFVIYKVSELPDASKTIDILKSVVYSQLKVEPFIIASNAHIPDHRLLLSKGFDGILNFRPQLSVLPEALHDDFSFLRLKRNIEKHRVFSGRKKIYTYTEALRLMQRVEPASFEKIIPSVIVGYDNTARRGGNGIIIKENYPHLFKEEFKRVYDKLKSSDDNPGFLFVNAWNEWAEGNHLEPDGKYGNSYLEMIKQVVSANNN